MKKNKTSNERWYIQELTCPELLHRNALQFGDRRFQWWRLNKRETASNTYAEVWQLVKELSSGLISLGFEKGDRGAIICHTAPQWVWADYAILCAGGITVCLYPTLSEKEIKFILQDSGSKVIFVQDEVLLQKVLNVKHETPVEKIIVMNESTSDESKSVTNFAQIRKSGIKLLAEDRHIFEKRWRSVEMTDLMTIVYTSGTTGMPKGAMHTHQSFNAACCRDMRQVPVYGDDEVCMAFLPLAHTYERECGHGIAMMTASTIAYSSPVTIVEDLQIFKPTIFMSVPRIYERIYMAMREQTSKSPIKKKIFEAAINTGLQVVHARSDEKGFIDMREGIDFTENLGPWLKFKYRLFDRLVYSKVRHLLGGRYRFAFSAAGSLPADLCKTYMAMGIRIFEGYGATETWNTINLNWDYKVLPGSVGPLCIGVEGRIAEDGEWQVRGENIFLGYWNNPDATNEAFTEDGFYKTGDIVEEVADGYIRIVDRKKGLMVLDTGKNVPSNKIESLFSLSKWIDTVVPVGSERKYVTALVIPNFDAFIELFEKEKIDYDKSKLIKITEPAPMCIAVGDDFIQKDILRKMIDADIQAANKELEEYETIKKYTILTKRLTVNDGEMTPTLKVKRKVVLDKYADLIDKMYN
ncbi:MAG TPA: long-chain fatty acid--CoA ligase [Spirochaetota bacterium]|jgi:long-chain acyl-CoA synthetase|nr:long-chain fatty acid--CoA ligase [Spirochaetota bacterium]HOV08995.1 long-chain fatty acid--CoA ligase [Spirochaetota bacterium]HRS63834.1 long-chain fatty acid--CoA ligase [Spirochaetota bacterium]HRU64981.1 long-chain fatty acid--CoA ligase [Spirochaetota bacterium]